MSDIRLYTGLCETSYNHHPVEPGTYACIAPVYGRSKTYETRVSVPSDTVIIQDSGAFSDNWAKRKTFAQAYERQILHSDTWGYTSQVSHIATYDLLIDEVWVNGNRFKRRWSVQDAEAAVDTTVAAAQWLHRQRDGRGLIISAQGVDAPQYLRCAERLMNTLQDGDVFGLGGWCIIGKLPAVMMPVFRDTVKTVVPFLGREGVKRAHIWGVIYPPALGALLWECDQYGIEVSTDSVGPSTHPIFGQWGYGKPELGGWRDNGYIKPVLQLLGMDRARHVWQTRDWLSTFRQTGYYKPTEKPIIQRGFAW